MKPGTGTCRFRRFAPLRPAAGREKVGLVGENLDAVAGDPALVLPLDVVPPFQGGVRILAHMNETPAFRLYRADHVF